MYDDDDDDFDGCDSNDEGDDAKVFFGSNATHLLQQIFVATSVDVCTLS